MKKFLLIKRWGVLWCLLITTIYLLHSPTYAYTKRTSTLQIQQQPITGTVTDAANVPIPGVNIIIKGKTHGTTTNIDGKYQLQAKPTDTLVFSYLGYKAVEMPVGNTLVIDVSLKEDATALNTVTINAGYYTVKDKERTGSIARITVKEIENQPVNNPLEALQGRMPGVHIVQNTGNPGGGFDVRIRGQNSIAAGNAPLYVIDGVPYDGQTMGDQDTGQPIIPGGNLSPLNTLHPADIESIEVLKDADATAIYGSRGANGVVLITTKKTRAGKTRFSVNAHNGMASITRKTDLMNTQQYLAMRREAFANDGIEEYPANAYDVNGTWDQNRYTDWQEELIGGTANFSNIQASLSGGSEQTQFTLGGTYQRETTVYPGDFAFNRGTLRAKINHRSPDEKFTLLFSTHYSLEDNTLPGQDIVRASQTLPPNAPALYDDNGELNWEDGTWTNPLAVFEGTYQNQRHNLVANMVLAYDLLPNVNIKANMGYTDTRLEETRTQPHTTYNPAFGLDSSVSSLFDNESLRRSWIIEPQIHWEFHLGKGKFKALAGTTFQQQIGQKTAFLATGFPNNKLIHNLSAASSLQATDEQEQEYRYQAVFGRLNYNYNKKYILNLTGRRDGSSRFGPGNRFANFGAVGAAWIFSEENFFKKNLSFLNFGKLRASYGTTGNDQIGDYQYLNSYSIYANPYEGVAVLEPSRLFNPDFGWEINKKIEAALEFGLFSNRVSGSLGYFRNQSSSQLVGIPLPGTTGFSAMQANLEATVENTGWEAELRTVNIDTKNFDWSTSFNITRPRNKLVAFPGLENSAYANQYVIGEPLSILKLYHMQGVDPETGVYQFEDYNQDGEITTPEDRQYLVDTSPQLYGGLQNQLRYKNWELDFLFQFNRQKAYNYFMSGTFPGGMANLPVEVLNNWKNPGDQRSVQVATTGANTEATQAYGRFMGSSAVVSDASFVRLKNIALSYQIPLPENSKVRAGINVRAQNLFTFTNFKGADPEQLTGFLPPLKRITAGIQLQF